jgi:spoIIIJ-associated protein
MEKIMADELVEEIIDEAVESADEQIVGQYPEITVHYKEGVALTDEELDTIADVAISVVRSILSHFDAEGSSIDEYEGDEGELILDITAPDLAVLIGRHGRTLESLQTLVSLLVSRKLGFRYPVSIDVEGYKSRRHDKVVSMAKNAVSRAVSQGRSVNLPPMSAYERRLVHIALREDDRIDTHSEGVEPERRVVITLR